MNDSNDMQMGRCEELVLLRLSVPRKSPYTRREVETSLKPLLGPTATLSRLREAIEALIASGEVQTHAKSQLQLGASGRSRLTKLLGAKELPQKWIQAKQWFVGRILGLSLGERLVRERLNRDMLGLILQHRAGLKTKQLATNGQALNALVWRELGGDPDKEPSSPQAKWAGVRRIVVARQLGIAKAMGDDEMLRALVAKHVGAGRTDADSIVRSVYHRWVDESVGLDSRPQTPSTDDSTAISDGLDPNEDSQDADPLPTQQLDPAPQSELDVFAHQVQVAAADPATQRFGDHKAYICSVFTTLQQQGHLEGLDLSAFKLRLVEAHRSRRLSLERADLVAAMDEDQVVASEVHYQNATFHFVRLKPGL